MCIYAIYILQVILGQIILRFKSLIWEGFSLDFLFSFVINILA